MDLPPDLVHALNLLTESIPRPTLNSAAARLSSRYRHDRSDPAVPYIRSADDAVAYAAYRMPATFAAAYACFTQVRKERPDFQPARVLDVGAGSGAATWAALEVWPRIDVVRLIERDAHMARVGQSLMQSTRLPAFRSAHWMHSDAVVPQVEGGNDLVLASYIVGEVSAADSNRFLDNMWQACTEILVVIEPGTPAGFRTVLAARARLLTHESKMIAPCPHEVECPMASGDWCHFSQRLPRMEAHRAAKSGRLSYEDEKFSYIAVSRQPAALPFARIVRHPQTRPGRIGLTLCTRDGLQQSLVTRRNKALFRLARQAHWGDSFLSDESRSKDP